MQFQEEFEATSVGIFCVLIAILKRSPGLTENLKNIHGIMHEWSNICMLFIIRYSFESKGLIFTL